MGKCDDKEFSYAALKKAFEDAQKCILGCSIGEIRITVHSPFKEGTREYKMWLKKIKKFGFVVAD